VSIVGLLTLDYFATTVELCLEKNNLISFKLISETPAFAREDKLFNPLSRYINNVTYYAGNALVICGFWIFMLGLLDILSGGIYDYLLQSESYSNHTALILHRLTSYILVCSYPSSLSCSRASCRVNWLVLNWPTSQLSLFNSFIIAGVGHAENAALCIVARDVTEVTWPFLLLAQSSVYRVT
jgi:hypothetical protein